MSPSEWRGSCFPESLGRKKQERTQLSGMATPGPQPLSLAELATLCGPTATAHSRSVRWVTTQAKMKAVRNDRERINA